MQEDANNKERLATLKNQYQKVEMSKEQVKCMKKNMIDAKIEKSKKNYFIKKAILIGVASAAVLAFVILPNTSASIAYAMSNIPIVGKLVEVITFRDYQYAGERNHADVVVPELAPVNSEADNTSPDSTNTNPVKANTDDTFKKTTEEINAEIKEITDHIVAEFEENLQYEEGYQDVLVKSEVISTTDDYFTLKLICYQGAGSGMEWNYFYTIDLGTGERLQLKDLFVEGSDYLNIISDNIKEQMRAQMAADDGITYWVDQTDVTEWNFNTITDETSFYLNENGNIVINFNEGDVAPMYMGVVEFEIPRDAVSDILK